MQRGIATLLAIALALWAVGVHMFTVAEAANLLYLKNTLSDSDTGSLSNHEIQFVTPSNVNNNESITVTFPSQFTGTSSVTVGDVDLEIDGIDETLVAGAPGATEWGFTWSGDTMTLLAGASESIATSATVTIKIGSNADGGTVRLVNPSGIQSYEFTVTAGPDDMGNTRVAIVDNVLVTANVNTSLTFTVNGTTTGAIVNGSANPTATNTTSNTLPFETLQNAAPKTLGQDLTVATNARNGYVVTVEQDTNLQSATGADIDGFIDGAYTDTPTAWQSPGNNVLNENTWGHWGLTSNDSTLLGAGTDFGVDQWVSVSTTPRAIMAHSSASDGTTLGIGRATIGYQAEITALQEAADDYSTTLTYIATPTF